MQTRQIQAETEKLEARTKYVETYAETKVRLQKLKNTKTAENTPLYRYTLALAKSLQNLWLVWMLLSLVVIGYSQRARWEKQVDFAAEGIATVIPANRAELLVRASLRVIELKHSGEILAFEEQIAEKRLHENVNAIRTLKGLTGKEREQVKEIETVAIPVNVPGKFTMTDLLNDPDLDPGSLPLGRNHETGMIAQARPQYLTCVDIVGKQNHCKSTILKMLAMGFFHLQDAGKELDLYLIDPHDNLPDALSTFLKPVLHRFKQCVLGAQAIERGDHTTLLATIEQELIHRQEQGYSTPYLVLLIDELNDIFSVEAHRKEFYRLLKKIRRLRKAGVMEVLTWHDSTKEGAGQLGTGLMSLNVSAFCVNSTKSKAAKVLENGDSEKAVNLSRGLAVLKIPGDDSEVVQLPYCQQNDLTPFLPVQSTQKTQGATNAASMIKDTEEIEHTLTPESCKVEREKMGLSQNKLKEISGVSQNKIWRYEKGKYDLASEESQSIYSVLFPSKSQKVVNLNRYRESPN